jgi:excisionase family DNA binding protein
MSPDNPVTTKRGRPSGPAPTATVDEVADALRVSPKTVYGWLKELCSDKKPLLPHIKLGNKVRIRVAAVENLPERMKLRRPPSFFSAKANAGGGKQ